MSPPHPKKGDMATILCAFAALVVANLFYYWRGYHFQLVRREQTLRERVAFMLWVMANGAK
jgi:hypothetical protein